MVFVAKERVMTRGLWALTLVAAWCAVGEATAQPTGRIARRGDGLSNGLVIGAVTGLVLGVAIGGDFSDNLQPVSN